MFLNQITYTAFRISPEVVGHLNPLTYCLMTTIWTYLHTVFYILYSMEVGIFGHSIGLYFCCLELGRHVHWYLIGPKSCSSKLYNEYHKSCDWLWLCHVKPHYCFHCLQIACRGNLIVSRLIRSWWNGLTTPQLWFVYISHTFKGSWC